MATQEQMADLRAVETITDLVERAMKTYAGDTAFINFGQTLTFAELDTHSRNLAAYLQNEIAIERGDRVALMMPNMFAFVISSVALMRLGAIQVNVNPLYTARELAHQLQDSGATTLIIFSGSTPVYAPIKDEVPVEAVVVATLSDGSPSVIPSPPVDPETGAHVLLAEALEIGADLPFEPTTVSAEDVLFLQYTGGTTGASKGAVLTHGNLLANIRQYREFSPEMTLPGQEVIITPLPLYHIFALMVNFLAYFAVGSKNYLITNPRDMDSFIAAIKESRLTAMTGVNSLFAGMMMHPDIDEVDFSHLKIAIGGGTKIMPVISDRWKALTGKHICQGYGLSETSPVLTLNPPEADYFSDAAGLPFPETDIRILGDDDEEVADGERGEVCAKGPQVMSGYWNRPEETKLAFTADGYFRTGDIAIREPNGMIRIVDRKKDMVLVSGFNVYPNEVEQVVSEYEGIVECACIGIPDEKTGETVKLFVVVGDDNNISKDEIIKHCRENLAAYKVPSQIAFIDAVPKSAVGKILRRELR
ncbi:MAG: AMP-binding protein [Stappiaceae bacterium]